MVTDIASSEQLEHYLAAHRGALVYFTAPDCAVCGALEPRVQAMAGELFPALALARVDCAQAPELAAQTGVFTIPTVIVYFEGQEAIRKARNFSLIELRDAIDRPYRILGDAGGTRG